MQLSTSMLVVWLLRKNFFAIPLQCGCFGKILHEKVPLALPARIILKLENQCTAGSGSCHPVERGT